MAIFLVLVGVFQGLEARANPEADAEPEAEAEAEANPDADPDAQYGSGSYVDVADENGGQGYYPGEQNGGQGYIHLNSWNNWLLCAVYNSLDINSKKQFNILAITLDGRPDTYYNSAIFEYRISSI